MTKSARRWLGLGATALVLGLIVFNVTRNPEWRSFDWKRFWLSTTHARPSFLLLAVTTAYLSYAVRAVRWKYFLDPIKSGSLWILFAGQILGFSSIYLIGRPGELVRPAYIAKREHVSFASQLAILLLERIYDTVAIVLLFGLALYFQPLHPRTAHGMAALRRVRETAQSVVLVAGLLIAGLVAFRLYSEKLVTHFERRFRFIPTRARVGFERFLRSLAQGLDAIRNWRDLLASVAWTIVLWFLNTTVFWLVFRSLNGELQSISWWAAAMTIFFAAIGLLVQLPGVGGGYQVGIVEALRRVLHVGAEAATSAGILMWIVAFVPCVALALLILLYEGLSFKRLRGIADEKKAESVVSRP